MERQARRLRIVGQVQGVGYRWWSEQAARRLKLDGWVRNCADGSVELLAIGPAAALDQLVEDCRQGPAGAVVRDVQVMAAEDDGAIGFETRR